MALPSGFVDLATAYTSSSNAFLNIIGVVVDIQSATQTRTGDYMITFKLLDEKLRDSFHGSQGLTVRSFKQDPNHLPPVRRCGDVVLLRNIKMSSFNQQILALSNFQTSALVFPSASIPAPSY